MVSLRVEARRTCSGGGPNAGTVREWYNGEAIDSGPQRDAGSRIGGTIGGQAGELFQRPMFLLLPNDGQCPVVCRRRRQQQRAVPGAALCPVRRVEHDRAVGIFSLGGFRLSACAKALADPP